MTALSVEKEIVATAQSFLKSNLTVGTWGNISCRVGDTLAITPSGKSYENLKAKDIVIIGKKHALAPSSELFLHQAIYKSRKDIQAIIHTHSTYATALACQHTDLPILTEDIAQLANGKVIKCTKYALAGTEQLAKNAVQALGSGWAILLANHGAVVCGTTLKQTLLFAELLEKAAQIYCICQTAGAKAHPLTSANIEKLKNFYFQCYAKRQEGESK